MILFPRARRRRPGIYVYRTRKHLRRGTEWGYVGESTNLNRRALCHAGTCAHTSCAQKGWYDLILWRWELKLPWWLGWKWLLRCIETVFIVTLRPRYNWQKNPRRRKVPARVQLLQRAARDRGDAIRPGLDIGVMVPAVAIAMMVIGSIGWMVTR